jgi:hypothetical protein
MWMNLHSPESDTGKKDIEGNVFNHQEVVGPNAKKC